MLGETTTEVTAADTVGNPQTDLESCGRRDRLWCTGTPDLTISWQCPRLCPQYAAAFRGKAHGVPSARGWATVVPVDSLVGLTRSAASPAKKARQFSRQHPRQGPVPIYLVL